jgi:hypothetical protein
MASTINASTTSTSGLVYNADASGVLQLQSNGVTGLTVEANASVSVNTVLQTANGRIEPLVSATAQTASGTSVDFTGIPSWAKRITVMFAGLSTNGTSGLIIQFGINGTWLTSGYAGASDDMGSTVNPTSFTTGFGMGDNPASTAATRHGQYTFSKLSDTVWVGVVVGAYSSSSAIIAGGGSLTLSGIADSIRVTSAGGINTFDAGTVNIMYE